MTKYPTISSIRQFIKRNYLKLLLLLLPGLLIFFGVDIMTGEYSHIPKRLCYLTMLQNLAYPYLSVGPGVYWYFSLTFQLYLLYAFAHKWMNAKNLIIWSVITLAILWLLGTLQWEDSFSIFRHCFTGWFPPFAIGIYYAQKRHVIDAKQSPLYLDIILAIALLAAMILMNAIFSIWLFIPILGLYWYIVLSKLVMRCGGYVMKFFVWIGKYSACIFVCHPIVRGVLVRLYGRFGHLGLITLAFFILTLLVAFYYDKLYKFAMKRFVK